VRFNPEELRPAHSRSGGPPYALRLGKRLALRYTLDALDGPRLEWGSEVTVHLDPWDLDGPRLEWGSEVTVWRAHPDALDAPRAPLSEPVRARLARAEIPLFFWPIQRTPRPLLYPSSESGSETLTLSETPEPRPRSQGPGSARRSSGTPPGTGRCATSRGRTLAERLAERPELRR